MSKNFFIYYLAAIGTPNLDVKLDILKNNRQKIHSNL